MQNRHMTGEEKNPKTKDEWRQVNGGMPLLTDLCLAMRSDPRNNLHIRTSCNIRFSGSSSVGLPQLCGTLEPDKCAGWDGTQLVSARGAESANE